MAKSKTRPVCSLGSHSYWKRKDSIQWRTHWDTPVWATWYMPIKIYDTSWGPEWGTKRGWGNVSEGLSVSMLLDHLLWRKQNFLFSISHSPVGKRSFTTYQPPPEHVGKDGLSREQTFPISGCREDFFWMEHKVYYSELKKKKEEEKNGFNCTSTF